MVEGAELAGPAPPLEALLGAGLAAGAQRPAVASARRTVSWRTLEDESAALARAYLAHGLAPGDRVASLMPNRVALLVHYLACFKAGL
ncbi:MAG: long-chain fatty acid--CoA ligase, partial [Solirubrobacterales bacterium]|nr:long-chain fatty acid--CoA ligase [Solirubrobacterales bacterium]